ncbi:WYL domain-containing protein [Neolewinella lacunae]|uniref:WYL domain-containing protein n=1 Tax=Neolewinella lacunae TaxID=1517758 RepID=A0A923TDS0_9BACT|nr:WYL domain-containing protein [Neolewinella lacunae]MBC6995157.1 WYL domain-containing protein [Neolewinella lacunae]MDN3634107.1 WYL domain-containing protein [Neolewinella lacunae]
MLKLLAAPKRLTSKQLGAFVGLEDRSSVRDHLNHIRAAGIQVEHDNHNRYYVLPTTGFKELGYLSPLNEADKARIRDALGKLPTAEAMQLANKIDSLLDFQSLGLEALRRPELEKINCLEEAIREKRRVLLVNYRSRSSNNERDRKVEVFGLEPENGMIRAYDTEKLRTAHFMLSRMDRVTVLNEPWMYESQHSHHPSDAFSIVDKRTVLVDLTLKVSAYNDLIERNPHARLCVRKGMEENTYQFSGRVNHKYIGLRQFIMANWEDVTIHSPDGLRDLIVADAKDLLARYSSAE